jgi:pimeloyl-ACP methyl ester carboxylesterase
VPQKWDPEPSDQESLDELLLGRRVRARLLAEPPAATADDVEAVRAHLGIPKLDLYGVSYGTYLMAGFAQRHPTSVRST